MINKDKMKGLLVSIGTKGKDEGLDSPASDSYETGSDEKAHVELAGKLISAIKQDNPTEFAKAFKDFVYLCQEGDPSEEENSTEEDQA